MIAVVVVPAAIVTGVDRAASAATGSTCRLVKWTSVGADAARLARKPDQSKPAPGRTGASRLVGVVASGPTAVVVSVVGSPASSAAAGCAGRSWVSVRATRAPAHATAAVPTRSLRPETVDGRRRASVPSGRRSSWASGPGDPAQAAP